MLSVDGLCSMQVWFPDWSTVLSDSHVLPLFCVCLPTLSDAHTFGVVMLTKCAEAHAAWLVIMLRHEKHPSWVSVSHTVDTDNLLCVLKHVSGDW